MARYHTYQSLGTLIERLEGTLPSGKWAGHRFEMEHWGLAGREFIRFDITDGPYHSYQYSGRYLPDAARQMAEMREALLDKED